MTNTETVTLNVTTRTERKKKVAELRNEGIVPGVLYGHNRENQVIQVEAKALLSAYQQSGENTLLNLTVDGSPAVQVLIHQVDRNYITHEIEHVDFFAVNMKEEVNAEVILHFVGEAPAVKAHGGVLVKNRDHITIKCLPENLISEMEVDISVLSTFEDSIHVKDLSFPDTVTVLDDSAELVINVSPPRTEEELAALEETVNEDVSAVAGVESEAATDETKVEDDAPKAGADAK